MHQMEELRKRLKWKFIFSYFCYYFLEKKEFHEKAEAATAACINKNCCNVRRFEIPLFFT